MRVALFVAAGWPVDFMTNLERKVLGTDAAQTERLSALASVMATGVLYARRGSAGQTAPPIALAGPHRRWMLMRA